MTTEFRAVLTCKQDPCSYCRGPAHSRLLVHPQGPFDTFEAAREYGQGMAFRVYGSEHSVTVESREVGEWRMHGGIPAKVGIS